MAERKECKNYAHCGFLYEFGGCPLSCIHYKHRDEVRVVRCKDCKNLEITGCYGECKQGYMGIVQPWDFCSHGERKDVNR